MDGSRVKLGFTFRFRWSVLYKGACRLQETKVESVSIMKLQYTCINTEGQSKHFGHG